MINTSNFFENSLVYGLSVSLFAVWLGYTEHYDNKHGISTDHVHPGVEFVQFDKPIIVQSSSGGFYSSSWGAILRTAYP